MISEKRKEYMKEYLKKYRQEHKEIIKVFYSVKGGIIIIPSKYKNKFTDYVDVVFLKSGILIYPHNDKNNYNENVLQRKLSKNRQISLGKTTFYDKWGYMPENVRFEEYKKGVLMVPAK